MFINCDIVLNDSTGITVKPANNYKDLTYLHGNRKKNQNSQQNHMPKMKLHQLQLMKKLVKVSSIRLSKRLKLT